MISLKYFIENLHGWDWCHYRDSHNDLRHLSTESLLLHAVNHGVYENRKFIFTNDLNKFPKKIIDKNYKYLKKKGYNKKNNTDFRVINHKDLNYKVRYFIDNLNKWNWKKYRDDNTDLN